MMLTTNELPAHLRRRVLAIIVQAPWRSDQPECPHGCGVCDAPLRFVETDEHGHHWYNCAACPNGHTSQDCCCTIHAKNEDGICLTLGMRARALAEPENFQHTLRMAQAAGLPVDESFAPLPLFHRHSFQGQTLMHEHADGDQPHGYYGHPEDFPKQPIGVGGYARQSVTWGETSASAPTFTMPKIDPSTMHVVVYDAAPITVSTLYDVATDNELETLDRILIAAGIVWKCPVCGHHTPAGDDNCDGCGIHRVTGK